MAFQDDYANYLRLFTMNQADQDFASAGADRVMLKQAFAVSVAQMGSYAEQGLVSIDGSRNMYIPTSISGVTVSAGDLPAPIYPEIESGYNPSTGQAKPPGYQPPPIQPIYTGGGSAGGATATGGGVAPSGAEGVWSLGQILVYGVLGYFGLRALGVIR